MRLWFAGGALILGAALLDLGAALRPSLEPVEPAVMSAARELVLARRTPGSLVLHSPLFGVSELAALGSLSARPDLPDAASRAGRPLFVIDRAEVPMGGLGRPAEVIEIGEGVVVRRFAPEGGSPGRRPVFDLRDGLAGGMLRIERPPGREVSRCDAPRTEGGFACPGQPSWLYAAPRRLRIDGQNVDCIWAHPTTGGAVVFELPAPSPPAAGMRLELELGAALSDDAVKQTSDGAPVTTRVRQSGQSLGQIIRSNAIGWSRQRFELAAGAPIRLEVTAPKDGRRHHCLEARVVEVSASEGGS